MKNYEAGRADKLGLRPKNAPYYDQQVLRALSLQARRLTMTPGFCLFLLECAESPNGSGRKLRLARASTCDQDAARG
jgi:hypothetical protein